MPHPAIVDKTTIDLVEMIAPYTGRVNYGSVRVATPSNFPRKGDSPNDFFWALNYEGFLDSTRTIGLVYDLSADRWDTKVMPFDIFYNPRSRKDVLSQVQSTIENIPEERTRLLREFVAKNEISGLRKQIALSVRSSGIVVPVSTLVTADELTPYFSSDEIEGLISKQILAARIE